MILFPMSSLTQIHPEVSRPVHVLWPFYFGADGHMHCAGLDELHCRTDKVCRQAVLWGELRMGLTGLT